jgi:ElaB/YqjD/DUF883 family membrane-anchored ribosome-binding protein
MKSLPRQPIRRASIARKVQELAKKFKHYVEKSMKEQPMATLAAAAAIAFALGALVKK